jgi:hypothetical protein
VGGARAGWGAGGRAGGGRGRAPLAAAAAGLVPLALHHPPQPWHAAAPRRPARALGRPALRAPKLAPPLPTPRQVAGELVARFREREEGVKGDVFAAYVALLEAVREGSRRYAPADPAR